MRKRASIFSLVGALLAGLLCAQQARDLRLVSTAAPANPLKDKGTRWAVVAGISTYQNLPPGAQLKFAHQDAQDFAAFLRSDAGGAIPTRQIRLLANEQATVAALRAALDDWLVQAVAPDDIVYFFFAGHGVIAERDEGYFVAYDSDPQNLHSTGLSFQEVERTLSTRLRAGLVVMVADACHAGRLGWTSYTPAVPGRTVESLSQLGKSDRSFLKLLASSPSERSFEDARWDGGHGVFTHTLLEGLAGPADRDGDRFVSAAEAIDYVSRLVPERTGSRQHPRVAGTFDARLPLARSLKPPGAASVAASLDIAGPAATPIYIDNVFRGRIRPAGELRVESIPPGAHRFSADFSDGSALDAAFTLSTGGAARLAIAPPPPDALSELRARIQSGRILEPDGAWELFRTRTYPDINDRIAAVSLLSGALEELGQACVNDYVQSTASGLKLAMLQRAVEAYGYLQILRPRDQSIEPRKLFCRGRAQIAAGRFAEAVASLEEALKLDRQFACARNALGVALARLDRKAESRAAFEEAARLTPEWGLPPFQIAAQLVAAGDFANARPYFLKSVLYSPRSVAARWNLVHVERRLGNLSAVEAQAAELIKLNPGYAPVYTELGLAYEASGNLTKAAEAYDKYVQLAPNFVDSAEVRARSARLRNQTARPAPSLRK